MESLGLRSLMVATLGGYAMVAAGLTMWMWGGPQIVRSAGDASVISGTGPALAGTIILCVRGARRRSRRD